MKSVISSTRRHLLISCEVFRREVEEYLSQGNVMVDTQFLNFGLHGDTAANARSEIQHAIDTVDEERYDAILIGYGLCNQGIRGLTARRIPLVLPRTHNCISLLLGSCQRYEEFLQREPDTYFLTTGWVDALTSDDVTHSRKAIESQLGLGQNLTELIAKYGEDNGHYLYNQLKPPDYSQHVYVKSSCREEEPLIAAAGERAAKSDCPLRVVEGDNSVLEAFLEGPWEEKLFLTTPPGKKVEIVFGKRMIDWKEPDSAT